MAKIQYGDLCSICNERVQKFPDGMNRCSCGHCIEGHYERQGVHMAHCCVYHGCKYGEEDCPVWVGALRQYHECEDCGWDERIATLNEINEEMMSLQVDDLTALAALCRLKGNIVARIRGENR